VSRRRGEWTVNAASWWEVALAAILLGIGLAAFSLALAFALSANR
jgi:hypothetical protein